MKIKNLVSAATAMAMAATAVCTMLPSVNAADASKGLSIEAYKEADSKYSAMGNEIKVSKEDIAAGDIVIPCAVYLDEATSDMLAVSSNITVDSKDIAFTRIELSKSYFSAAKDYAFPDGTAFSTDLPVTFAGSLSSRGVFLNDGSYQFGLDASQSAAGTDNYFLGCSWTNGGTGYSYTGTKSTDHPFYMFNVVLPKGLADGEYNVKFCKYNTDLSGEYDNPTPMIEVQGTRYTIANNNLNLKELKITVGDGAPTGSYVLGDTNEDGVVDAIDASAILTFYAQSSVSDVEITDFIKNVYDVNKDGIIDATDASAVLTYYALSSTGKCDSLEAYLATLN